VGHSAPGLTTTLLGRPRIDHAPGGGVRLRLLDGERDLLRQLPGQLRDLLDAAPEDPSLRRLFPPAYEDERDAAEYDRLVRAELHEGRRESLRVLAETADRERLTGDEANAWLTALNDLRLVLGTRLDVSEDTLLEVGSSGSNAQELALYGYLSGLQEELVTALAAGLEES